MARALKGSLELPTEARLLEPVHFARPARLADARSRANLLFELAGEVLARPQNDVALARFHREVAELSEGIGPLGGDRPVGRRPLPPGDGHGEGAPGR